MNLTLNFEVTDADGNVVVPRSQIELTDLDKSELARDHLQELVALLAEANGRGDVDMPPQTQEIVAAKAHDSERFEALAIVVQRFIRARLREWAKA